MLFNDFKHLDVHKCCGDVKKRKTLNYVRPNGGLGSTPAYSKHAPSLT